MKRPFVTDHAADRYVERVKPAFTRHRAILELAALCELAGEPSRTAPDWADTEDHGSHFLTISDGIVATLEPHGERWAVVTVLTRSGMSQGRRAHRNKVRSAKTAIKRFKTGRHKGQLARKSNARDAAKHRDRWAA